MTDHARDLESVRTATERLLDTADRTLNNAGAAEPSLLPGWTRGHLLAHLARNADALGHVLEGRPMYRTAEARDADIERDAGRPLAVHLADLRESTARFFAAAARNDDWSRTVALRNGVTDAAARVPFRRLAEVELHHVDLGIGYRLEDLPPEFTDREIDFLAERFAGHPAVPSTGVSVDGGRRLWATGGGTDGGPDGGPVAVRGSAADVLGWLAGRRDGAALRTEGGPLPVLPPL
jgi:maleylpyruvate isomerase